MKNHYVSGQWNVTCDVCSKKLKSGDAKQRWDGFIVCPEDYEVRHPQDFVRARQDKISVPFTRPIPPIIATATSYIFYWDGGYTQDGYIVGDNI